MLDFGPQTTYIDSNFFKTMCLGSGDSKTDISA